ncbi:MAG: aldose epimerase [Alphaproteobacteria bacterium PA4]|nr:MAG: aldose epimerase [Alphaproteobacteria bacterium PA4]
MSSEQLTLSNDAVRLDLAPARGGGITRFDWRDEPIFAPVRGPTPEDMACIPLVPFANRIAQGRFRVGDTDVQLPLLPGQAHALHGDGWLADWAVVRATADSAVLRFEHDSGAWPWRYRAEQTLDLHDSGYRHSISLTNCADTPMPAGIGLHPWLPRTADTRYLGLHCGEWQMGDDQLPALLDMRDAPRDWWQGATVASRSVDTCHVGRDGPLTIVWPARGLRLVMRPSPSLGMTHVYVPMGAAFFCVEPVSHSPDAINRRGDNGLVWLAPGATLAGSIDFTVTRA